MPTPWPGPPAAPASQAHGNHGTRLAPIVPGCHHAPTISSPSPSQKDTTETLQDASIPLSCTFLWILWALPRDFLDLHSKCPTHARLPEPSRASSSATCFSATPPGLGAVLTVSAATRALVSAVSRQVPRLVQPSPRALPAVAPGTHPAPPAPVPVPRKRRAFPAWPHHSVP